MVVKVATGKEYLLLLIVYGSITNLTLYSIDFLLPEVSTLL